MPPPEKGCSSSTTRRDKGSNIKNLKKSSMGKRHQRQPVEEDIRIGVDIALKRFLMADEEKELEFPSSFTSVERAYIHQLTGGYGLTSKSRGKGASRFLTVYKRDRSAVIKSDAELTLTADAKKLASVTLTQYPVTSKERKDLLPPLDRGERNPYLLTDGRDMSRAMGKLNSGIPQIPPPSGLSYEDLTEGQILGDDDGILEHRKQLPIWSYRSDIIRSISQNQVTIVTGETGSGKTTQVPQFILENCFETKSACRIICTEPRRLAAVTMAERVAFERGEKVGQTVGFQIRLESRVSPRTLLTFCTNGVLLRTLMGSGPSALSTDALSSLATISHVIVDEVHERDRFSDFLLTVLRDALNKFKDLKIIIMSATIDVTQFMHYFTNANHIAVPGKMYPVQEIYLENILLQTGYSTPLMEEERKIALKLLNNEKQEGTGTKSIYTYDAIGIQFSDEKNMASENNMCEKNSLRDWNEEEDIIIELDEKSKDEMDTLLSDSFMNRSGAAFEQLANMVFDDGRTYIDYSHSKTGVNALMCAAGHGRIDFIEHLLVNGADPLLKAKNGWTAKDFALQMGHKVAGEIIDSYQKSLSSLVVQTGPVEDTFMEIGYNPTEPDFNFTTEAYGELNLAEQANFNATTSSSIDRVPTKILSQEEKAVLRAYHKIFDDDSERGVDKSLIVTLVKYIVDQEDNAIQDNKHGSILIFLPGYEDIVGIHDVLKTDSSLLVLMLHSQMVSIDQKKIFRPPPKGITKVILSTNIAETSITIDDVTHVIDTGKVKEKSYDSLTGVSVLNVTWISRTSAIQRKGRAGRTQAGVCYRVFSSVRYSHMSKTSLPEILRTPLMELCLATKLLAPVGTPIADFLARAPDPPSFSATRAAVQGLKCIEAIDSWEDVTELGNHLLDLPVEPRLGKMVLYAVALKCLDPVLTIVCCATYKDPFILPSDPNLKKAARTARIKFAGETISDHMALLRVFQEWQKARVAGNERSFCSRHQVSSSTMEMVTGIRTQLLGQLRASGFVRAKGFGDIRDLNRNSENWAVVKAALVAGAYPNLARYDKEFQLLRTSMESKVRLHPGSVILNSIPSDNSHGPSTSAVNNRKALKSVSTDWFMFDEMTRAGRLAMIRGVTAVSPITVAIFAGPNRLDPEMALKPDETGSYGNKYLDESSDSEFDEDKDHKEENRGSVLKLDDWTLFRTDKALAHLVLQLRQKWSTLFLRRLHSAGKPMSQVDDSIVQTLVNILSTEEHALGLTQPVGIGQRPKPIPPNESVCSTRFAASLERHEKPATLLQSAIAPPRASFPQPTPMVYEDGASGRGSSQSYIAKSDPKKNVDSATKYFIIKATIPNALEFSLSKGLWQFGNQTERRLIRASKAGYTVILIFSVQGSSHFQGFALFSGRVSPERFPELQNQGQGSGSGFQYFINWIKKGNVPFQATKFLTNPYNDNKKVQTSRDGQELEQTVGAALCKMWDRVPHYTADKQNIEGEREQRGTDLGNDIGENFFPGSYPRGSQTVARYESKRY